MPSLIKYPDGPCPPGKLGWTETVEIDGKKEIIDLSMLPGEGINAQPFESVKYLDLEFPMGVGSGVVISLMFQLGKWNYEREKIDSFVEVTPVFTEYYQKTMEEKRKLESQIKNGFASLTQAVQDFELIYHDVRKYRQFMNYFQDVKEWEKKLEEAKTKEEKEKAESELKRAQHVIKAMFVDEVDAYTGETVAMRNIAVRWPTIISDFFALRDEDDTIDKVMKRANIAKPEAAILATKNQLFVTWKNFFLDTIKERYRRLRMMAAARKASIIEYRNQIIPLLSRYKALTEYREVENYRKMLQGISWFRPDTEALSLDFSEVWAWKPFTVKEEPFKSPREAYDKITLREAGFNSKERKELREAGKETIPAMPVVPIMDKYVRGIMKQIQAEYKIKMTAVDVYNIVEGLSNKFKAPEPLKPTVVPEHAETAIRAGPRWEFSPYFIFLRIPILRMTLKLPNGGMVEDIIFDGMQAFNCTQNIIIGRLLELNAMKRKTERDIGILLGNIDPVTFEKIDDIVTREYPDIYVEDEEERKKIKQEKQSKLREASNKLQNFREKFTDFRSRFGKFLAKLGLNLMFVYPGPYEKLMYERMSKMMQRGPGVAFLEVDTFLKRKAGVPGV